MSDCIGLVLLLGFYAFGPLDFLHLCLFPISDFRFYVVTDIYILYNSLNVYFMHWISSVDVDF